MISKGIFGIGCSYMWGEGLYYYSTLPDLPPKSMNHSFDGEHIRDTHCSFKNKYTCTPLPEFIIVGLGNLNLSQNDFKASMASS